MKKIALGMIFAAASLMAADGATLYKKCVACHGVKAEKPALGKSEVIAGWDKAKLVEELKAYKAGTLNRNGMGAMMKGQMASFSDADIEAVAEYISTLK
ncbi:MAG: c-type cytochrome [Wolinella succinogenes]|uniref:c-type cytochrome n=1 Tax=Wolinella succinogenes TaxID=844 RepID=UPI0016B9737B|nr:c-type cytochrome [Wolinella succinogenes]NLU34904.1 c-type cytochrome [Wolinella succinogenes]